MSNYENLPATKLLASHCAVCGRPLLDAKSVELGMGETCRKRHGFEQATDEKAREEVNAKVYAIALWRSTRGQQLEMGKPKPPTLTEVIEAVARIKQLGFTKLASILEQRLSTVSIEYVGGIFLVYAPYSPHFIEAVRPFGRWDEKAKAWTFTTDVKSKVYTVLRRTFPSTLGLSPTGLFPIPHEATLV